MAFFRSSASQVEEAKAALDRHGVIVDPSVDEIPLECRYATLRGTLWSVERFPTALDGIGITLRAEDRGPDALWLGRPDGGATSNKAITINLRRYGEHKVRPTNPEEAFGIAVHEPIHVLQQQLNGTGHALLLDPRNLHLPSIEAMWPEYFPQQRSLVEAAISTYATKSSEEMAPEAVRHFAIGERIPTIVGYVTLLRKMFGNDERAADTLRMRVGEFRRSDFYDVDATFATVVGVGAGRYAKSIHSPIQSAVATRPEDVVYARAGRLGLVSFSDKVVIVGESSSLRVVPIPTGSQVTFRKGMSPFLWDGETATPIVDGLVSEALYVRRTDIALNTRPTGTFRIKSLSAYGSLALGEDSRLVDQIDGALGSHATTLGLPIRSTEVPKMLASPAHVHEASI